MNKIITLSGWGQAHDALANVVPDGAIHIDYSQYADVKDFYESLRNQNPHMIIGWSLGGQLAMRAISEGIITPKALVLLATPYQFVVSKDIKCAMDRDTFNSFYRNFESDPVKTLKRFTALISLNDSNAHEILANLRQNTNTEHAEKWLYWLEELENFSCNELDFSKMPKTYALHGRNDTIVDVTQTGLFKSLLPNYTLEIFDSCGHAPHLHNAAKTIDIIKSVSGQC